VIPNVEPLFLENSLHILYTGNDLGMTLKLNNSFMKFGEKIEECAIYNKSKFQTLTQKDESSPIKILVLC
jgi:hypothetical protein